MSFSAINHNFLIESKLLNSDNEILEDLSGSIVDIMVRKRYLEESFPLFVIDLKTTEAIRNTIRDNDCKIYIRVSYYNNNGGETEDSDDVTASPEGIVLDKTVRIYEKPFNTTTSKKDVDSSEGENTQTEAAPFIRYRVHGIPEDLISKNEGNVNNIFKDAAPIDALVYMLSSINASNPKIQEGENKEKYTNIIIPPISIVPAVKLLQSYYYVYKEGISLFFDNSATYCFSPFSENKPKDKTFEINVLPSTVIGDTQQLQVPMVDENGNIKTSIQSLPTFTKNTKVGRHTKGSETIYYTYDESFNLSERSTSDTESYTKVRYIWNEMFDKKVEDEFDAALKRNSSMAIGIGNINPEMITPYTEFNIIASDYPLAEGAYALTDISYVLTSNDLKHYTVSCALLLIKK